MSSIIAVIALAVGTFWLEAPGLIRRKHRLELVVFIILLLVGTTLYAALAMEVRLPNPLSILKTMYRGMS
ncbi:hypothetical protein [Paenibacillus sp. UNC451MF]|uniref:hypothetical protein n=1 Tax=Paenibacillus sp. UNC451MF TaxID=1449063 RepID=UPI000567A1FC|nr:hypothetical protein [Paenibacillus sp. UNC451MF]